MGRASFAAPVVVVSGAGVVTDTTGTSLESLALTPTFATQGNGASASGPSNEISIVTESLIETAATREPSES